MCLAIVKPKGKTIPEEHLRNGFDNNKDGAGLCYAHNGKLYVAKAFNIDRFLEEYHAVEHLALLVHFRLATHGKTDLANCHPWLFCNQRRAAIHNGIVNIHCPDKDVSDTGTFIRLVLEPLLHRMPMKHPAVGYLIEQAIGGNNKIAVMDTDGDYVIYNEESGEWIDGIWYSNHGYRYSLRSFNDEDWNWSGMEPYWRKRSFEDKIMEDEEREELIESYVQHGFDKDTAITCADAEIEENKTQRYAS